MDVTQPVRKMFCNIQNYFTGDKTTSLNDGSPENTLAKAAYIEGIGLTVLSGLETPVIYNSPAMINAVKIQYNGQVRNALVFGRLLPAYKARSDHYNKGPAKIKTQLDNELQSQKINLINYDTSHAEKINSTLTTLDNDLQKLITDLNNLINQFDNFDYNKERLKNTNVSNYKDKINEASKKLLNLGVEIASRATIDPDNENTKTLVDNFNTLRAELVEANICFENMQKQFDDFCPSLWGGSYWRIAQKTLGSKTSFGLVGLYKRNHRIISTLIGAFIGSYGSQILGGSTLSAVAALGNIIISGGILGGIGGYFADTILVPEGVENLADSFVQEGIQQLPPAKRLPADPNILAKSNKLTAEISDYQSNIKTYKTRIEKLEQQQEIIDNLQDTIEEVIQSHQNGWFNSTEWDRIDKKDLFNKIKNAFGEYIPQDFSKEFYNSKKLTDYLKKFITENGYIDQAWGKIEDAIQIEEEKIQCAESAIEDLKTELDALLN